MREFKGKTAFVTGGASGIGFAMAKAFAEEGMNVMLADVEQSALDSALKDLHQYGNHVRGVACDVAALVPCAPQTRRRVVFSGRRSDALLQAARRFYAGSFGGR